MTDSECKVYLLRKIPILVLLMLSGCDAGHGGPTVSVPPTRPTTTAVVSPATAPVSMSAATEPSTRPATGPATAAATRAADPHRLPVRPGLLAVTHDQIMDRIGLPLLRVAAEAGEGIYSGAHPSSNYGVIIYGDFDRVRKVDIAIRDTAAPGKIEAEYAVALAILLDNIIDDVDTANWVFKQMGAVHGKKGASVTRQSGSNMVRVLWMEERKAYGVSITPAF